MNGNFHAPGTLTESAIRGDQANPQAPRKLNAQVARKIKEKLQEFVEDSRRGLKLPTNHQTIGSIDKVPRVSPSEPSAPQLELLMVNVTDRPFPARPVKDGRIGLPASDAVKYVMGHMSAVCRLGWIFGSSRETLVPPPQPQLLHSMVVAEHIVAQVSMSKMLEDAQMLSTSFWSKQRSNIMAQPDWDKDNTFVVQVKADANNIIHIQ